MLPKHRPIAFLRHKRAQNEFPLRGIYVLCVAFCGCLNLCNETLFVAHPKNCNKLGVMVSRSAPDGRDPG
jgi:hypothetical protein